MSATGLLDDEDEVEVPVCAYTGCTSLPAMLQDFYVVVFYILGYAEVYLRPVGCHMFEDVKDCGIDWDFQEGYAV